MSDKQTLDDILNEAYEKMCRTGESSIMVLHGETYADLKNKEQQLEKAETCILKLYNCIPMYRLLHLDESGQKYVTALINKRKRN